jgi:hypothetical protein
MASTGNNEGEHKWKVQHYCFQNQDPKSNYKNTGIKGTRSQDRFQII